jgi:hypothetical protein
LRSRTTSSPSHLPRPRLSLPIGSRASKPTGSDCASAGRGRKNHDLLGFRLGSLELSRDRSRFVLIWPIRLALAWEAIFARFVRVQTARRLALGALRGLLVQPARPAVQGNWAHRAVFSPGRSTLPGNYALMILTRWHLISQRIQRPEIRRNFSERSTRTRAYGRDPHEGFAQPFSALYDPEDITGWRAIVRI